MLSFPESNEPTRDEIDALKGATLIEFGASWCEHCLAAKPLVAKVMDRHPEVRFIWVEDGKGKALGRSFRVKLWPTLIFLKDGREVERLVRPIDAESIEQALGRIAAV